MSTLANSEDPDEMQHISGFTLFVKVKKIFRQKTQYFVKIQPDTRVPRKNPLVYKRLNIYPFLTESL